MKTLTRVAFAGTAVTAALVMGAGTASAATVGAPGSAGVGTPTAAYQVCGTAYVGADAHVGAPPSGAKAVEGVEVTGQLFDSSGTAVGSPWSTTTATDGTWCLQGDATMASTVQASGYVTVNFSPATVSDSSGTYSGQMSGGGADATIDALDFYSHAWPAPSFTADRAWKVNVVYQ